MTPKKKVGNLSSSILFEEGKGEVRKKEGREVEKRCFEGRGREKRINKERNR